MLTSPFSILHLSDLHFGRIQNHVLNDLIQFISARKEQIHLTVLTGDLTQRARSHEFIKARNFLVALESPFFLVPGNHDVPLYNLFLRFFSPYRKFLKYIGPFASQFYEDDHVAIFGLWTPDNFKVSEGKLSRKEILMVEEKFKDIPTHKIKIIASHHPLVSMDHPRINDDMARLHALGTKVYLWGHEHQSHVRDYIPGKSLMIASGTSTSSRIRHETNSFNLIHFKGEQVHVEIFHHTESGFISVERNEKYLSL